MTTIYYFLIGQYNVIMFKLRLTVILTLATTILGIALSLFLPAPEETSSFVFHLYFGMALAAAALFVGSSILFLMGFGAFTGRLKRVYLFICIGFILLGLAMFELPALLSAGLLESVNREKGYLVALPFIASIVILLIGTNKLGRLFAVKSITLTWWLPVIAIAVFSGLMFVVPHAPTHVKETEFDSSVAAAMACWVILTFNLIHVLKVKKVAGVTYTPGLAWMTLCFIFSSVVAAGGVVGRIFYGDDSSYAITAYTLIPLVPAGLLLMRSAYAFNLIPTTAIEGGAEARNFFGKPLTHQQRVGVSSIDVVVYTAQLASNPKAIDDILDDLRAITARTNDGNELTTTDQDTLLRVYLRLEDYLTTHEPVRKFTKLELRQQVTSGLDLANNSGNTFWNKIPALQSGVTQDAAGAPRPYQAQPVN